MSSLKQDAEQAIKQNPVLGLLPDWRIKDYASLGMITPFHAKLVRRLTKNDLTEFPVISYGASSYGYDLRLDPSHFQIFRHLPGTVVNPKRFNPDNLVDAPLHTDEDGSFFILPANSYGLGVTLERLSLPPTVTAIFLGKSTYARCGVIANLTPGEAGWKGHLVLEFSNSSSADVRIYANEGVVQALFFDSFPCHTPYDDTRKYQNQGKCITTAKV
jgi:dCTP deaminase